MAPFTFFLKSFHSFPGARSPATCRVQGRVGPLCLARGCSPESIRSPPQVLKSCHSNTNIDSSIVGSWWFRQQMDSSSRYALLFPPRLILVKVWPWIWKAEEPYHNLSCSLRHVLISLFCTSTWVKTVQLWLTFEINVHQNLTQPSEHNLCALSVQLKPILIKFFSPINDPNQLNLHTTQAPNMLVNPLSSITTGHRDPPNESRDSPAQSLS